MENEKKINELQEKLEQMYQERSKVENSIFRQEEKFDIRKLPETDVRYRNMVYLRERYSTLDLEIQKVKEELEKLQESSQVKEDKENYPSQKRENEKTYDLFGTKFTEKQIIEAIYEGSVYYYDIIDIIRENETIRDIVLRQITSLEIDSEEYADYRKLLDEIYQIRAKELGKREAKLSALEAEEKTIAEAEALIEKQTGKEGQDIGEN